MQNKLCDIIGTHKILHLNKVSSETWHCSSYSKCFFKINENSRGYWVEVRTTCVAISVAVSLLLSTIVMIFITGFRLDVFSASIWMIISPLLVACNELRLARMLEQMMKEDKANNHGKWRVEEISLNIPQKVSFYLLVCFISVAIFLLTIFLFRDEISGIYVQRSTNVFIIALGILAVTLTGFSTGSGAWGFYKLVKFLCQIRKKSKVTWYPFEPRQLRGYELLSSSTLIACFSFSLGSLFAPVAITIFYASDQCYRWLIFAYTLFLFTGSAIVLPITLYILYFIRRTSYDHVMKKLSKKLNYHFHNMNLSFLAENKAINSDSESTDIAGESSQDLLAIYGIAYTMSAAPTLLRNIGKVFAVLIVPGIIALLTQFTGNIF